MTDCELINHQVQTLFDEANQPNIFSLEFQFKDCLETLKLKNIDSQTSIKIMVNILNAVLYLKTNKLNPCQIKFSYIGCDKQNNWGLKHAICFRTKNFSKLPNSYDPTEILYHTNQDNQLIWNLGKTWLRFYTNKTIKIIDTSQQKIDQIIDENVSDYRINNILKRMLCVKKQKRISLSTFIQDDIFSFQNSRQNLYSSICFHINRAGISINQKVKNSLNNKRQIKNPFEEQIFRRNMEQSLQICVLLQKSCNLISSLYQKSAQVQFSKLIIKAQAYCILKNIDEKKSINEIVDYNIQQRKFYTKFVTKMYTLKQQLERKIKMKIFFGIDGLKQDQKQYLISTDQMRLSKVHGVFKKIMVDYYCQGVEQLKCVVQKKMDENERLKEICVIEKRCLIFLLSRLCNQIFSELRTFIFEDYLKRSENRDKILSISELLQFIENNRDAVGIRLIRKKVYENGLAQNNESNKKL